MFRDFIDGLKAYRDAIDVISEYGLKKYMFITGAISLVLGGVIVFNAVYFAADIAALITGWYKWEWGRAIFLSIASFLSGSTIVLLSFLVYKYLILILVSPFMSPLSEKIEREVTGNVKTMSGLVQSGKGFIRGLRLNIRNFIREIFITLGLLLLGLIPGVGLAVPFLIFAVQAYYVGFGNLDYMMERHMSIKGSARFVKRHMGLAIANGTVFLFLLMIPILGLFLAPTLATTAATLSGLDRLER